MELIGGKYRIIDSLGRGGNGQVYLAENTMLNTRWAVKKIDKRQKDICWENEIEILKKLKHKYLPVLFDVIDNQEFIYLIEEYVEGETLKSYIESIGHISEDKVLDILKKLCNVLHYLHSSKPNPIIYRDIKPSNIMLLDNGEIKLLDFGIAREFKDNKSEDTVIIGTKGYAAPEQYGGFQTDERSDIYSLGVTIHHMLTGKKPYRPPYEFLPVKKFNNKISRNTQFMIDKCLEIDPKKRFQSVQEILNYIDTRKHKISIKKTIKILGKKNICILDNGEFSCELATVAATKGIKVLLIDLCYFSNILDAYFKDENHNIAGIDKFLHNEPIYSYADIENYIYSVTENLYVLPNNYSTDYLTNDINTHNIKKLLNQFHLNIIILNRTLCNSKLKDLLEVADYILFPQTADYENTSVFNAIKVFFNKHFIINCKKLKYIAYKYKKGISVPVEDVKGTIGKDHYFGHISYNNKREKRRNLYNVTIPPKKTQQEYINILANMNIV